MTTTTAHTGTARYLAYELIESDEEPLPTTASDVHALGCVGMEVYPAPSSSVHSNDIFSSLSTLTHRTRISRLSIIERISKSVKRLATKYHQLRVHLTPIVLFRSFGMSSRVAGTWIRRIGQPLKSYVNIFVNEAKRSRNRWHR
jgi:hypothetical protein